MLRLTCSIKTDMHLLTWSFIFSWCYPNIYYTFSSTCCSWFAVNGFRYVSTYLWLLIIYGGKSCFIILVKGRNIWCHFCFFFQSISPLCRYKNRPVMSGPGLYDPTTVLSSDNLTKNMREGWIKLAIYLISFFYYIYGFVFQLFVRLCRYGTNADLFFEIN